MMPTTTPIRAARLGALAKLPIFLELRGERVLLVGGGEPAVWKAELLLAAGARLAIVAEAPHADLRALVDGSGGAASLEERAWREEDLAGVRLVVADEAEDEAASRLAAAARRGGVLLNVIDNPTFCDFQFGTIVNRSPVVIGIMTDGAAPILGQAIRRRIEAVIPASLADWAAAAKGFRDSLKALLQTRVDRRAFWERFVDTAFASKPGPDGGAAELERIASAIGNGRGGMGRTGSVTIVGAGPGDPELLTLKAMRALQAADVIVYDRLVTPEILELGRREARRVHVGKEGHGAACRQEDISALIVDLALAGERVVRLKGGDPAVFGRTGEEVAACREAGVPVAIVPGITTASAAAASLDLSLTHRDHARRIQFVTGHDRHGALPADLDVAGLADSSSTLVVYMARRTGALLARRLVAHGLAGETPILAVTNVSRPDQAALRSSLGALAEGLPLPEAGPIILLIGAALCEPSVPAAAAEAASA